MHLSNQYLKEGTNVTQSPWQSHETPSYLSKCLLFLADTIFYQETILMLLEGLSHLQYVIPYPNQFVYSTKMIKMHSFASDIEVGNLTLHQLYQYIFMGYPNSITN